jgi:hypothetical protein
MFKKEHGEGVLVRCETASVWGRVVPTGRPSSQVSHGLGPLSLPSSSRAVFFVSSALVTHLAPNCETSPNTLFRSGPPGLRVVGVIH